MNAYVVLMRRWGNIEGHTYIAGIWPTLREARLCAEDAADHRGGKYEYQIFSCSGKDAKLVVDTCGDQALHYESLIDQPQEDV